MTDAMKDTVWQYQTTMEKRICAAEIWMGNQIDGTFVWPIYKFDERRTLKYNIYSEYFFGKMRPYKMSLGMYPNGYRSNVGTGLSIYLYVYHDYMNTWITWPFTADVTITIVNKACPHACKTITKHCVIQKPKNNSYKWSDAFEFSFSELSSDSLLVGNCFMVECRVDLR